MFSVTSQMMFVLDGVLQAMPNKTKQGKRLLVQIQCHNRIYRHSLFDWWSIASGIDHFKTHTSVSDKSVSFVRA